jgi:hypothetical protein
MLRDTSFPQTIVPSLIAKINELKDLPAGGHRFFNQALEGRALEGSRRERWCQLLRMVESQI